MLDDGGAYEAMTLDAQERCCPTVRATRSFPGPDLGSGLRPLHASNRPVVVDVSVRCTSAMRRNRAWEAATRGLFGSDMGPIGGGYHMHRLAPGHWACS
jgi:hypothetical protein